MNIGEERIQIKGKVNIGATMSYPYTVDEKAPAVLLIAGSGPGNRDGNQPSLELNLYKLIAESLTDAGYISLRYDKRGVGESEGDLARAGMWDLVDDAESALNYLREHPHVDENRIFVLGHSEGTMLATALNERTPVSGLILIAGAGDTIESATKYQRELAYEEMNNETGLKGWLIKKLKVTEKAEKKAEKIFRKMAASKKDMIRVQFVKMPAKWFREHFHYDLKGAMKKVTCPVLAINGSKDIQTRVEKVYDVPELVSGPAEVHVINGMNHVLRQQEGNVSIQKVVVAYREQVRTPLHRELMPKIIDWLNRVNK
ncbi:alpha/beta hydrolase family protein [Anaerobacillus sp. MEB173]|uniref:alpha/beta hydrolase family protein n=1 Tax=Anaerobacillus sp. MEB173 TaxID=3383345 RepID=UPI003F8E7833